MAWVWDPATRPRRISAHIAVLLVPSMMSPIRTERGRLSSVTHCVLVNSTKNMPPVVASWFVGLGFMPVLAM